VLPISNVSTARTRLFVLVLVNTISNTDTRTEKHTRTHTERGHEALIRCHHSRNIRTWSVNKRGKKKTKIHADSPSLSGAACRTVGARIPTTFTWHRHRDRARLSNGEYCIRNGAAARPLPPLVGSARLAFFLR